MLNYDEMKLYDPEIAEAMSLSESHIHRLHGVALLNFTVPEDPGGKSWGIMKNGSWPPSGASVINLRQGAKVIGA